MAGTGRATVVAGVMVPAVRTAGSVLVMICRGDALAGRRYTSLIVMADTDHRRKQHDQNHEQC